MKYRNTVLLPSKTLTADNVEIIDLLGLTPLSRLTILFKCTNNGAVPTAHPAKCITKIELVDGADVIFSTSGQEAQAIAYYQNKKFPFHINSWWDDQICAVCIPINFGRYLWDEKLAFDPSRYKNPQLKITTDLNGGGSAPDANTLEVTADLFDEKVISPIGHLATRLWKSYSLVSSGWETTELPTDRELRAIYIKSIVSGKQPYEQYNELKLSQNNDQKVIYENNVSDILKEILMTYPDIAEQHEMAVGTTIETFYCAPTYEENFPGCGLGTGNNYINAVKTRGGVFEVDSSADGTYAQLTAHGYCPHGMMILPLGKLEEVDDGFPASPNDKLRLKLKGGSSVGSSSTCEILVEQVKRY